MNSYKLYIKQAGEWQEVTTPVFPFSWGELLDERLDEAYVTIYDNTEQYNRLTEVKVSITTGENTKDEYFIIASDTAVETPVGSGTYQHDIYLIERTKLLEGIVCSSLTFTNPTKRVYATSNEAWLEDMMDSSTDPRLYVFFETFGSNVTFDLSDILYSPMFAGKPLPTAYDVANRLAALLNITSNSVKFKPYETVILTGMVTYTTQMAYNGNTYGWQESPDASLGVGNQEVVYTLCFGDIDDEHYAEFAVRVKWTFTVVDEPLPLKKISITDAIIRVCELADPLYSEEVPRFRLDGVKYDGAGNVIKPYPAGSLAKKYEKVFCPEVTLTQNTLREQLKVIFSYVHAEPWLDEDNVIHTTEYGNTVQSDAGARPYVYNAASSHINEYCTEIRSNAQNLVSSLGYAKGVMIDPANGLYRSLRSDISYARINEDNGFAKTEKPIYEIQQVKCGIIGDGNTYYIAPSEITPYVFEEQVYNANLSSYLNVYPKSKAYAIYYTMGQAGLKGLFYQAPHHINEAEYSYFSIARILSAVTGRSAEIIHDYLAKNDAARLVFSITYKPISNHFVSHGKTLYKAGETPYAQIYNQGENLVESQFFGENIKGVAARLGNVEKERTFILKDINDVPKVGQMLDGYAITTVSCELYPFDIKCTVGLSKDFNRISEHVGINSHKRMYEISERQATQRDILIKETLVIDDKKEDADGVIFNDLTPFAQLFNGTVDGSYNISLASYLSYTKSGAEPMSDVALPVICRFLGNTLTFNFAFKDNYSAGNATEYLVNYQSIKGRWEIDVPYGDAYGRIYWGHIWLFGGDISQGLTDGAVHELAYGLPDDSAERINRGKAVVTMPWHRVRKDNRETLSYNLELEIKTAAPDIIIGSALASLNGWVNDTAEKPVVYLFKGRTIGKLDRIFTKQDGDIEVTDSLYFPFWSNGKLRIFNALNDGYSWALCNPIKDITETVEDEDGNAVEVTYQTGGEILLASNTPIYTVNRNGYRDIYFYVKKK